MSPEIIASTIAAALSAGAVSNAADASSRVIAEEYERLHGLLRARYSHLREAIEALEQLEDRPWSEGRRLVLAEELGALDTTADLEITAAVTSLIEKLNAAPRYDIQPARPRSVRPPTTRLPGSQAI